MHVENTKNSSLPFFISAGFPCGSAGKESACNEEDLASILGLGRSPEEGKGYPLQYYGLENSMDCVVQRVTKSQTQLIDFRFTLGAVHMGLSTCGAVHLC